MQEAVWGVRVCVADGCKDDTGSPKRVANKEGAYPGAGDGDLSALGVGIGAIGPEKSEPGLREEEEQTGVERLRFQTERN